MLDALNEVVKSELGESYYFTHDYPRDIYELWRDVDERPGLKMHLLEIEGEFARGVRPDKLPHIIRRFVDDISRTEDLLLNGDPSFGEPLGILNATKRRGGQG